MTTARSETSTANSSTTWRLATSLLRHLKIGDLELHFNGEQRNFGGEIKGPRAVVIVHDDRLFRTMLTGGSLAAAESYVEGWWDTPDLTQVVELFAANLESEKGRYQWLQKPKQSLLNVAHWLNRNTLSGSRKNIQAHYDLGNDLFSSFLDNSMMYSAAIFPTDESSLEQAQQYRLQRICEKLNLNENNHLLEIGTGWGSLAIYAAENFGCRVTTTTISDEQHSYVAQRLEEKNLTDKVTLLKQDYRLLEGQFDRLVSIEMIEAVGQRFLSGYFQKIDQLLTDDGIALLQSITIPEQRYNRYKNSVDFIRKYIFPGGHLPSLSLISEQIGANTSMTISNVEDLTLHYAQTLKEWHKRFVKNFTELNSAQYSNQFYRLWRYYLAYCEGGFRQRAIGTSQIVFCKRNARNLWQPK
jgi:cyclopropane-fatty-acyl-phospholipid synthase